MTGQKTPLTRAIDKYVDDDIRGKSPWLIGAMEGAINLSMADPSTLETNVQALVEAIERQA